MERIRCPNCNAPTPKGAIGCTKCGIRFGEWEREQADRLENLTKQQKNDLAKRTIRMLLKPIITVATLISLIFGVGIWRTCTYIDGQVKNKFAEPQVEKTFSKVVNDAAETHTKELIDKQIQPIIDNTQDFIHKQKLALRQDVENIRQQFNKELLELKKENEYQKELRSIQQIQDQAILGSYEAFRSLREYKSDKRELVVRAHSAASFVKGYYVGKSRVSNKPLSLTRQDGSEIGENDLAPNELISIMKSSPNPFVRSRAAKLLRNHRNLGVPEALLEVATGDDSLWARTEALSSFALITGFDREDVFAFDAAAQWYTENHEKITEDLKPYNR